MNVQEFWQAFRASFDADAPGEDAYQVWSFGDTPAMADELGALTVQGVKTGTASLAWEYNYDGDPLPRAGEYSIVLDGRGDPLCIIETTRIYIEPYNLVDEEQAYAEGEGDRSLAYWREAHWDYFSRRCEAIGREPSEHMPIVCERFRVVKTA
ncbi:ASCH domain-containing protein [Anaerolineae bacterium CFX7]|nr:ASCH domain-containing protein [Anaerolineae bacterium CFX7]